MLRFGMHVALFLMMELLMLMRKLQRMTLRVPEMYVLRGGERTGHCMGMGIGLISGGQSPSPANTKPGHVNIAIESM